MAQPPLVVLGAGAWGTALAVAAAGRQPVLLWARDAAQARRMQAERCNARYLPDAEVASLQQSYELSYHALSQRYLLRNLNTGEQQDFGTLQASLDRLAALDAEWVLPGHGAPWRGTPADIAAAVRAHA